MHLLKNSKYFKPSDANVRHGLHPDCKIGECPLIQSFVESNSFCKCDTSFWISIGSIVVSAIFLILSLLLKGYTTSAKKPRDAKDSGSKNLDSNSSQTKEQEEFLDEIKQNSSHANSNGGMSL